MRALSGPIIAIAAVQAVVLCFAIVQRVSWNESERPPFLSR